MKKTMIVAASLAVILSVLSVGCAEGIKTEAAVNEVQQKTVQQNTAQKKTVQTEQRIEIKTERKDIGQENKDQSAGNMEEEAAVNLSESPAIYRLRKESRLYEYLWDDGSGEKDNFQVYIYEPEAYNGHTVCVDAGHGDNSHLAARTMREKVYPVPDEKLAGMNTSMVGSQAYGYGVEARAFPNVYDGKETEPEFALKTAKLVRDRLLEKGYRVVMTRTEDDQNLSNGARSVLASETSDIMVAIHTNASGSHSASGTVVYYPGEKDGIDGSVHPGYTKIMGISEHEAASKCLADGLAASVSQSAGLSNLGTSGAALRIFSYSAIPVCLVEVGFSDHPGDARILIEEKERIADGIVQGIETYFEQQENQ